MGHHFNVDNHPNSDSNRDWLILGLQTTITPVDDNNTHQFFVADTQFIVQPVDQTLRPDRTIDKPIARSQTAMVMGPEGATGSESTSAAEEIHTDEYGRVKVKFHWDRPSLAQRGLVFAEDSASTCWLRVSTAWAGNNFGTVHIPRVGQEVIVDFFGGDSDMPYVSGRLSNPDHMPNWVLPKEKALSGIKSKEYQGSQSNQLVMDDSTGELQVHLKSDHEHSELNLGHITRIPDASGRADFRGTGFELRTDGHGVIRADKGLVLTSFGKTGASSYVKDISETLDLIKAASNQQVSYSQSAIDYMADDGDIIDSPATSLKNDYDTIDTKKPREELSLPHLVQSSPASISQVAEGHIHQFAKEDMTVTTGKSLSFASGKRLVASVAKGIGLFTHSMGIRLISASGKIEIFARSDDMDIIADEVLKIISKRKSIEISAMEEITLNVQGNYIKITPDNIEQGTKGDWTVYAAEHKLIGPKTIDYGIPEDPYDEMYILKDTLGNVVAGYAYKIKTSEGKIYRGVTNEKGETIRIGTANKAVDFELTADSDEEDE